jgi:hypothetical protein
LALQLTEEVESIARDRERPVPEAGMFWKLRILHTEYTAPAERTSEMAKHAQELFRGRHAVYFLETLAAGAWVERRRHGGITNETEKDLELFETWGALGLRASLAAQGFLPELLHGGPTPSAS